MTPLHPASCYLSILSTVPEDAGRIDAVLDGFGSFGIPREELKQAPRSKRLPLLVLLAPDDVIHSQPAALT